jgi:hypothetical protein
MLRGLCLALALGLAGYAQPAAAQPSESGGNIALCRRKRMDCKGSAFAGGSGLPTRSRVGSPDKGAEPPWPSSVTAGC